MYDDLDDWKEPKDPAELKTLRAEERKQERENKKRWQAEVDAFIDAFSQADIVWCCPPVEDMPALYFLTKAEAVIREIRDEADFYQTKRPAMDTVIYDGGCMANLNMATVPDPLLSVPAVMQPAELATVTPNFQPIIDMVLNTVSERSQRDYGRALKDFMTWYQATGQQEFTKAAINAHIAALKAAGVTDSSINQRLAAIRKLAREAADNGLISESAAQPIARIANIKRQGKKLGNWLTREQARAMLAAPDTTTVKGLRDRAILAVMLGCGLRREEIVKLEAKHLQQREGRWVILDLQGKHNRTRTVPMASWVKALIDQYAQAANIAEGVLFHRMLKGAKVLDKGQGMSSQAVWDIVQEYAPVPNLAPHDLRRTFAKLAAGKGAPLVQIQKTLGHASIQTTENYIGADQDLKKAPSDYIDDLV